MDTVAHGDALWAWEWFWGETVRLLDEAGRILADHLRERPFEIHETGKPRAGEIVVGGTRLRLECLPQCVRPRSREPRFSGIFGEHTPLARIVVYREAAGVPFLCARIAIDPVGGRWASGPPELGPAPLSDSREFESLLWSLLVDVPAKPPSGSQVPRSRRSRPGSPRHRRPPGREGP